jgi:diaminopimelate epimerase
MKFTKAHAYGNDFLYVHAGDVQEADRVRFARELCDRHTGVGADGLIFYERDGDAASMVLLNADGSRAEVSGNGLRGLAALLLQHDPLHTDTIAIRTAAGDKTLTRVGRSGSRQTFRAAMGTPAGLRRMVVDAAGDSVSAVLLNIGNPQCVLLGALPDDRRFRKLGAALERHALFPEGTNVEFAYVASPDCVQILIWERGVGPTRSSGTGSCAALVAAAAYGGAARDAEVVAPGGTQRVEWLDEGVFLTGWAEVVCEGEWLRQSGESTIES